MLDFREGESHTPTPKPTLIFIWIGATKRQYALYVLENSRNKHLGRFIKFCSVGGVIY